MNTVPIKVYVWTWVALMVGFLLNLGLAAINLGPFNVILALAIALFQMSLVILFFMHARHGSTLVWLFAATGFYWIGVLFVLGLNDYLTRGWQF